MAATGREAIGSMGDDTPLAVLSNRSKPLYAYFRQLFAQVTNPPIDPIREELVMSLVSFIGPRPNILDPDNSGPNMRLEVSQPILTFDDMEKIRSAESLTNGEFRRRLSFDNVLPRDLGCNRYGSRIGTLCASADRYRSQGKCEHYRSDRS